MTQSLYEVLGIEPSATADQIKRAYRLKAKQHHPDREGGDHEAMQQVQKAYDVLSDPDRRKQYDESGRIERLNSLDEAAMAVLASVFKQFIEQDASAEGAVDSLSDCLKQAIGKFKEQLKHHPQVIDALEQKARAIRRRVGAEGADLYQGIIAERRKALENARLIVEARIPVMERALELLKDYESGVERTSYVMYMHTGGFSTGGTGYTGI